MKSVAAALVVAFLAVASGPASAQDDPAVLFASAVAALHEGRAGDGVADLEALADRGVVDPVASYDRGLAYAIRGRVNGMWQAAFAIGQFLSGMVVTLLSHVFGGLLPTLAVMGRSMLVFAAIAALTGLMWPKAAAPVPSAG